MAALGAKLAQEGDADKRAAFACTDEEWQKVLELRERCADLPVEGYWGTEQCMHRFVVARKLDVDAAEQQYRGAVQWRKVCCVPGQPFSATYSARPNSAGCKS